MKKILCFLLVLSSCLPLCAQLYDYLPQTPAMAVAARKNYKTYILTHKIKSVTKWKIDTITKSKTKLYCLDFNQLGDTTQLLDYSGNSPSFKINCLRDKQGRLVEENHYAIDDTVNPFLSYQYIYKGTLVKERRTRLLDKKPSKLKVSYVWDGTGKLLAVDYFDTSGAVITRKELLTYDNHANRISFKVLVRDSLALTFPGQNAKGMKMEQLTTYGYDTKNLKTIKHFTGGNAKVPVYTETFQYDLGSNITEYQEIRKGAGKLIAISYDEKKSVVLCEFRSPEGKVTRSVASSYGKNESLVQEIDMNMEQEDLNKRKKTYKYKYFKDDNIAGCEVFWGTRRIERTAYTYESY